MLGNWYQVFTAEDAIDVGRAGGHAGQSSKGVLNGR